MYNPSQRRTEFYRRYGGCRKWRFYKYFRNNGGQVGIQLLDKNNTPVEIGKSTNIGSVTGEYNYPMTARYYRLSNNVPPDEVDAIANVSIIYN
ncbi:hypothetical protein DEO48_07455 [Enterobacter sp. CGMCC 5087]|nr:hypothetical protein DEO48_07455 [Enterobacter sp. CGMCC 5087]